MFMSVETNLLGALTNDTTKDHVADMTPSYTHNDHQPVLHVCEKWNSKFAKRYWTV